MTSSSSGASLVELIIVLGLIAAVAGSAMPMWAQSIDAGRARQAAGFLAGECRRARQEAVSRSAMVALVFDQTEGRWGFRVCVDGNANGVRRADITKGKDACVEGPVTIEGAFPGVSIALDPTLPDPDGGAGKSDPVQLGSSDIASFSDAGTSSSGTVYLRSAGGAQFAVRIAGATGRTRVLRFDTGAHKWTEL